MTDTKTNEKAVSFGACCDPEIDQVSLYPDAKAKIEAALFDKNGSIEDIEEFEVTLRVRNEPGKSTAKLMEDFKETHGSDIQIKKITKLEKEAERSRGRMERMEWIISSIMEEINERLKANPPGSWL